MLPLKTTYEHYFTLNEFEFTLIHGEDRYKQITRYVKMFEQLENLSFSPTHVGESIGLTAESVRKHYPIYLEVVEKLNR